MLPFSNDDEERIKMVIYFDTIIQDITLSKQVEQSIYNYIIRLSKEKKVGTIVLPVFIKDGENAVFINEKNYQEKFLEYIEDKDNPKWKEIADAGREYALKELNNDNAVDKIIKLIQKLS